MPEVSRFGAEDLPDASADRCVVCGSCRTAKLYDPTYRGTVGDAKDYFLAHRLSTAHGTIVRCLDCGFVFTSPRFTSGEYDQIYGGIVSPDVIDPSFDLAKMARFRRLANVVRKHVGRDATFLDLGCGDGAFLRYMDSPAGRGFEVGPSGHRSAGRSEIVVGDWSTFAGSDACPPESLDYLTAFDVLEHLPRIEEDVAHIHAVLKPGGLFFASVPDIDSLVAKVMGKRWNMLLLEHLWYFSSETLTRFLARFGFRRIAFQAVPFDAPLAHIATRLAQTFGKQGHFALGPLTRTVLPVPAGIMLGVFERDDHRNRSDWST